MSPNVEDKPSYDDKMSCEIIALPNNYLVTAERASFSTIKCRQIANPSTNEGSAKIVSHNKKGDQFGSNVGICGMWINLCMKFGINPAQYFVIFSK